MKSSVLKAFLVFLLLVGCNQPDGAIEEQDPPPGATPERATIPAADHEKLQMEVQTALKEIEHETERIQVETRTKSGAMTKAHLDNIAELKDRIDDLRKELAEAEKTETLEFRRFRKRAEGLLADWDADIRALEQTVMWAGAGQPVD